MVNPTLKLKRFILIPSAVGVSHLARLVLVALELRRQGAEVAFAYIGRHEILERHGFEVFDVPDVAIADFSANIFAAYTRPLVEACVRAELKATDVFKPDAVVGDLRLSAAISSRVAGLPYIAVVNGYMTDAFEPVNLFIERSAYPFKHQIAALSGRAIQTAQKRLLASAARSVARPYGVNQLVSLYDFLHGDLTLIADLPEFCPLSGLPPSVRCVGPLIWEGTHSALPEYFGKLDYTKRIVYATTGNTGDKQLTRLIAEAFQDQQDYEVILTTGQYSDPKSVPQLPNLYIKRFIPGSAVLKHCHVAVHCGGNGTTYQVLSQGVPAVVVPFNNDQRINALLIKKHRLGIPLDPAVVTPKQVRAAVEVVAHDQGIRQNIRRFQQLLAATHGPANAATEIFAFMMSQPSVRGQLAKPHY